MDPLTIIALIGKGISVLDMAITAGKNAKPVIDTLKGLITGAEEGTVTDEQLARDEAFLDSQIEEFNKPL